jgi:hypothetical protein
MDKKKKKKPAATGGDDKKFLKIGGPRPKLGKKK